MELLKYSKTIWQIFFMMYSYEDMYWGYSFRYWPICLSIASLLFCVLFMGFRSFWLVHSLFILGIKCQGRKRPCVFFFIFFLRKSVRVSDAPLYFTKTDFKAANVSGYIFMFASLFTRSYNVCGFLFDDDALPIWGILSVYIRMGFTL